jgi:hypothetical protein
MKADSVIIMGCVEPAGVTEIVGDFPRGWTFLSSGGARWVFGLRWKISSS